MDTILMHYQKAFIPGHIEKGKLERLKDRSRTFKGGMNIITGEVTGWGSRTKSYKVVTVESQGRLLKVHSHRSYNRQKRTGGGDRGDIRTFSRESRRRLLDHFARLDRSVARRGKPILFVTLTYQENMTDHDKARRDLKVWWERVVERHEKAWCVWKKEMQERGAIHFHLIVGNVGFLGVNVKDDETWDAQLAWNEVTGQTAKNSLDVERLRSFQGVMAYAGKYLGKEIELPEQETNKVEYPIAGITKRERLRTIARHGIDPCIEALQRRERYRVAMGLSISHKCSHDHNGSFVGRFWGILGRKHVPYAKRMQRTIAVKKKMYSWWLSVVDSEYCAPNRGFTVYTEDCVKHYMRIITAYNRYHHSQWLEDYERDIKEWWRTQELNWRYLDAERQARFVYRSAMSDIYGFEFDAPP